MQESLNRPSSIIPQIFNFISFISSNEEKAHCPKVFEKTRGSCCIVSKVRVKSEIVTFASQRIIEFKQFLRRPNLARSVAKMIVDFFRF